MKFAFTLPNNDNFRPMLNMFVDYVIDKYPNMTITGLTTDSKFDITQGIYNAGKGAVIVVSKDNNYDVDWYPTREKANKDGLTSTLNMENDWGKIKSLLALYNKTNGQTSSYTTGLPMDSQDKSFVNRFVSVHRLPIGTTTIHNNDSYVRIGNSVFVKDYGFSNDAPRKVKTTTIRVKIRRNTPSCPLARLFGGF